MALVPISGIDHINMCVTNLERSIAFYRDVFGFELKEDHRGLEKYPWVNLGISGAAYLVLYETQEAAISRDRRIIHFGFALKTPERMDELLARLARAGIRPKTNSDGTQMIAHYEKSSSVYLSDPDGYEIDVSLAFGGGIDAQRGATFPSDNRELNP